MFRLLIWLLLAYTGFRIIKGFIGSSNSTMQNKKQQDDAEDTVQDPVCKRYLDRNDAITGNLDGTKYYFCSMECLNRFQEQLETNQNTNGG